MFGKTFYACFSLIRPFLIQKGNCSKIYIKIALDLTRSAEGQLSINPFVDAICVKEAQIIGTGADLKAGTLHAELHALAREGAESEGVNLYITLEPCTHTGKTPSCRDLIVSIGIRCVFISSVNPYLSLKTEQLAVKSSIFSFCQPRETIRYLESRRNSCRSSFNANWGQQMDYISCFKNRCPLPPRTHDAILVGVQSVLHNNPFLTT